MGPTPNLSSCVRLRHSRTAGLRGWFAVSHRVTSQEGPPTMQFYEIRSLLEDAATPSPDDSKEARLLRVISAALLGIAEQMQEMRGLQEETEVLLQDQPVPGSG